MPKKNSPTDSELLRQWHEGDAKAGERLVLRHYESLSRFLRTKIGDEAADLTQQAFSALCESAGRYSGKGTVRAFLYGIARNKLMDSMRKAYRSKEEPFDPDKSTFEGSAISLPSLIDKDDRQKLLLRALRVLAINDQLMLEFHYWEGMTVAEVAAVLEMNVNTVKTRMHRARQRLMKEIARLAASSELAETTQRWFEDWAASVRGKLDHGERD